MSNFSQLENGILAAKKDLESLEKNENSKILVVSDSHGDAELFLEIVKKFGQQVNAIIFAGDGVFDLFYVIEKAKKHFSSAKCLPPVIAFAKGNNDPAGFTTDSGEQIIVPPKVTLKTGNRTILVTHGHSEGVYYDYSTLEATAQTYSANAVIFGHTHVPAEFMGKTYIMNPGSISLPRHRSLPSFAILEISTKYINSIFYRIEFKHELEFIPYHPESFYGF